MNKPLIGLLIITLFLVACTTGGNQPTPPGNEGDGGSVVVQKSNIPPSNEDESEFDDLDSALEDLDELEDLE